MDVLIFGGQSNMQGQTESLPPGEPVAGAFEYRHREGMLVPLAHPVGEDFGDLLLGAHEGHGSLLPAFCRAYREVCKEMVVAIHAAKGATTLADWAPSGKRYAFACEKIRAGLRAAAEREEIRKVFYIWLQGESDALAGTGETAYLSMLAAYKNALLRDLPIDRFAIIRVGYFTAEPARDLAVMLAQERAANEDADFLMLTRVCAELSRDAAFLNPLAAGHYNNAGMEEIGSAAGRALGEFARQ